MKPGNIKITPEGVVKVLDFGLAKNAHANAAANASISPTLTIRATEAGLILGTAAYMSPEQAAGKPVDKRADIWSFGVVLWEMMTGKRLFDGETISHTLADVLRAPIDFDQLPKETPTTILDLLRRCLDRDVRNRLRDIGEARILLAAPVDEAVLPAHTAPMRVGKLPWLIAAVLLLALAALGWRQFREQPAPVRPMSFQIPAPERTELASYLSMSPDGRRLAFRATDGQVRIWVRSLDSVEARPLPGTEGADSLFWSPDSRYLAFSTGSELKKVDTADGAVQTLAKFPPQSQRFLGGAWSPDGTIIFAMVPSGLMRVHETGGAPAPLTIPAPDHPTFSLSPSFLPDGRHFVYEFCPDPPSPCGVYLRSLDTKPEEPNTKPLVPASWSIHQSDTSVAYAPSADPNIGYVLFERDSSLMALPIDVRRLIPAGQPIFVAQGIGTGARSFSASANAILAFRQDSSTLANSMLLWFDRHGKQLGQLGPPGPWTNVALSRDGKLATISSVGQSGSMEHVWTIDTSRGVPTRLNPGDVIEYAAFAISPDGRIAFTYNKGGVQGDIYVRGAGGVGEPEPLLQSNTKTMKHADDWSADGRFLIYDEHTTQKEDLWVLPMAGERKPIPFLVTPADEAAARFSPDSRWVAYDSDESGRSEVYVQGFLPDRAPTAGIGKWQISTAGGFRPQWRRDGKELYYFAPDDKLMAVPVTSTATGFQPGVAVPLFQMHSAGSYPYDVAPDGRFLINTVGQQAVHNSAPITVVLNWWAGLKQ